MDDKKKQKEQEDDPPLWINFICPSCAIAYGVKTFFKPIKKRRAGADIIDGSDHWKGIELNLNKKRTRYLLTLSPLRVFFI